MKEQHPDLDEKILNEIMTEPVIALGLISLFALMGAATFMADILQMTVDIFNKGSIKCAKKYARTSYYHVACVCKAKLDAYTKLIKKLNSKKGKCSSENDPIECQKNIELALRKLKVKVSKEKIRLNKAEQAIKKDVFKY